MAEHLDPILRAFWEGFPCPPPWKTDLLFQVNTSCIDSQLGDSVKLFMAEKCGIDHEGFNIQSTSPEEKIVVADCGLNCKIVIILVCLTVILATVAGVLYLINRKASDKPASSPNHQTALNPSADPKYYSTCHYSPPSVYSRQSEITIRGNKAETRLLQHYYPPISPYSLHPDDVRYQQARDLELPDSNSFTNYRKLPDGDYSPSSGASQYSDKSPIYEYIDSDSNLEDRRRHPRESNSVCTCNCGETGYGSSYYSDTATNTQTLQLRPIRNARSYVTYHENSDIEEPMPRRHSRSSNRSRSSRQSNSSYCAVERNRDGTIRRTIPAVHPHYFAPELPYR
ncbi:hypothetical protein LOTGIDRAFT_159938 [Lottia gigantea]|uniref:Uncharacterized protein n=1 Tax=Lottia gigantea TaxID=225164 RepID=V4AHY8_LOTGI|nr:hypothetical protein LOTGIDRAFT_159938 [Lottia gigantea]ESO96522.1 hypothetical protein LOTGIDRAFT_159938 [Lottia gigantea]